MEIIKWHLCTRIGFQISISVYFSLCLSACLSHSRSIYEYIIYIKIQIYIHSNSSIHLSIPLCISLIRDCDQHLIKSDVYLETCISLSRRVTPVISSPSSSRQIRRPPVLLLFDLQVTRSFLSLGGIMGSFYELKKMRELIWTT